MRPAIFGVALLFVLGAAAPVLSADRRPKVEQDECARRSAACEQGCDAKGGMDRLSCKTDCRLSESRCRNGKR
ncbi:MAG: hypothetical protein HY901_02225 [Deltaproteobacteria bacterium]|nr:hypothetical protein [Deltaproteobacteria bacterium]